MPACIRYIQDAAMPPPSSALPWYPGSPVHTLWHVHRAQANEDIETYIEMLAETGPFRIPVRCLTKKAGCGVSCGRELDFGHGGWGGAVC